MEIILTHENMDFDALASLVAASKLHPHAKMVLPSLQSDQVKQYLAIYRDSFSFLSASQVAWEEITHVILTDVNTITRTVGASKLKEKKVSITVYDHHPLPQDTNSSEDTYIIQDTGAAVTIIIEEMMNQKIDISSYEATLFALGLYTDTGSFTYPGTTIRDLKAAAFLMEHGMQLDVVQQFSDETLSKAQQQAFQHFLNESEHFEIDGLEIVIASFATTEFVNSLNSITSRVLETTGADVVVTITDMKNKVFVIGRSATDRFQLGKLMEHFNGGGHSKAASASIKNGDIEEVKQQVSDVIPHMVLSAVQAVDLMSAPVKTIEPATTMEEAKQNMLYYGHNGLPVVNENGQLVGIISRRDIDKATQHGYGHAPVKAYMTSQPVTITTSTTFEEIQQLMIEHNIGRLPVMEDNKIIGIVSRTDVIEHMHESSQSKKETSTIRPQMEKLLPEPTFSLLERVGELADSMKMNAFIVGGVVRDLIMGIPNEDIDIVLEGNGIEFAEAFANKIGGTVKRHETFYTATVETESGIKLDFTTSRTEYYEKPAALPTVSRSNIKEDLFRRDFTMNAIAASLQPGRFGELIDHFHGLSDIHHKRLRVLHNLSFVEDPTRILRGIRFEERFGFRMDEQTEAFIRQSTGSISALSKARIITELRYLFSSASPVRVFTRLSELGVLDSFLPGAVWSTYSEAVLTHFLRHPEVQSWSVTEKEYWFFITLCLYIEDFKKSSLARMAAETRQQKKVVNDIFSLLEHYPGSYFNTPGMFHNIAHQTEDHALLFTSCVLYPIDTDVSAMIEDYRHKRKDLTNWVGGDDLKEAGISPGPSYKNYLFQLEQAILDHKIKNRRDVLQYIHTNFLS